MKIFGGALRMRGGGKNCSLVVFQNLEPCSDIGRNVLIARELITKAKAKIDAGHFAEAHELLRHATQTQIAAAREAGEARERARSTADVFLLGAAHSTAAEGDVALTELRYGLAAQLFGEAAAYVPEGQPDERLKYMDRQADTLLRQGDERGDNGALHSSIEIYRRTLEGRTRAQQPLYWAQSQNNLGFALWRLGGRESGTARLEAAVVAYRAALEENTRERVPLAWATTEKNLGSALETLGEREVGTARLELAVKAHRAVLEELTRERVPLDWAAAQNDLGNALRVWLDCEVRGRK